MQLQPEPLAITVVGVILSTLLGVLITLVGAAWRDMKREQTKTRAQVHNVVRMMFSLLRELHPSQAAVIASKMEEYFIGQKPASANGKSQGAWQ